MGEYQYESVGEISAQIAVGYNVVNVDSDSHMLVQPGDVVGWYMPDRQTIPFNEGTASISSQSVWEGWRGTQAGHVWS